MGWSELLVIGIVALIVVGPKDLPGMFREFGKFTAKLRGMAREFQRAMEDAADQSGVGDVAKTFKSAANPGGAAREAFKDATRGLSDWDLDAPSEKDGRGKTTAELTLERQEAIRRVQQTAAARAEARRAQEAEAEASKARVEAKMASAGDDPGAIQAPEPPRAPAPAPSAAPTDSGKTET